LLIYRIKSQLDDLEVDIAPGEEGGGELGDRRWDRVGLPQTLAASRRPMETYNGLVRWPDRQTKAAGIPGLVV